MYTYNCASCRCRWSLPKTIFVVKMDEYAHYPTPLPLRRNPPRAHVMLRSRAHRVVHCIWLLGPRCAIDLLRHIFMVRAHAHLARKFCPSSSRVVRCVRVPFCIFLMQMNAPLILHIHATATTPSCVCCAVKSMWREHNTDTQHTTLLCARRGERDDGDVRRRRRMQKYVHRKRVERARREHRKINNNTCTLRIRMPNRKLVAVVVSESSFSLPLLWRLLTTGWPGRSVRMCLSIGKPASGKRAIVLRRLSHAGQADKPVCGRTDEPRSRQRMRASERTLFTRLYMSVVYGIRYTVM